MRSWINLLVGCLLAILAFGIFVTWIAHMRHLAETTEEKYTPPRGDDPWERP